MFEMDINKYINFDEIWCSEVVTDLEFIDNKLLDLMEQFNNDDNVYLDVSECEFDDNKLYFVFSESGGQNESDTQGWFRRYELTVDEDFMIIDIEYEQG